MAELFFEVISDNVTHLPMVYNISEANRSVMDEESLLQRYLGDRHLPTWSLVLLNIIYITIFITGMFGNMCTCIVIARNKYLHTATNYYLFSLAVSDLLILLLALPSELYSFWEAYPWRFGFVYCISKSYIQEVTSYASVLTITAFTIERYLAICHPMKSQIMNSPARAVKLIIIQWIISCVCALPFPIHTDTFFVAYTESGEPVKDSLVCNIPDRHRDTMTYWFQISTFVFFVYPMSVITVMYVLIGVKLSRSQTANPRTHSAAINARKAIIKMLVAVVISFFVCWAPFHAQRLFTIYIDPDDWTPTLIEVQNHVYFISGILFFVSATVNPILYNAMSKKYRRAFFKTILPCVRSPMLNSNTSNSNNSCTMSSPYMYNRVTSRPFCSFKPSLYIHYPRTDASSKV